MALHIPAVLLRDGVRAINAFKLGISRGHDRAARLITSVLGPVRKCRIQKTCPRGAGGGCGLSSSMPAASVCWTWVADQRAQIRPGWDKATWIEGKQRSEVISPPGLAIAGVGHSG